MKHQIKFTLALASITLAALSPQAQAQETKPTAVKAIDVTQYTGKWYEIAHLPMYFQRNCVSNTTAQYALNTDKTIAVTNSCKTKTGEMNTSKGIAYAQNNGNSKLKVSFLPTGLRWLPFTKGDYWVLRVDPDYKVALVGGPSNKYLWILSRTPALDDATYQSYLETAKQQGYDISQLIKTPHKAQ